MNRRGFTLIELLVVIAIIGILSAVILASLNTAVSKGRDAQRESNLHTVSTALELYYNDHGTYVVSGGGYSGGGNGWLSYQDGGAYAESVTRVLYNDGYLASPIVEDPTQNPGYMIYICNNGQQYALSATLENPTAQDKAYIQTTCNGTGGNGTYTNYGKNFAIGN